MDLGLKGRKAIVCASSRGLGKACARALAEAGCEVVLNGRDLKKLEAAAGEIASLTGAKVIPVAADVATPEGQKALLAACPQPDILINNNAGPPMRDFRELTRQQMLDGVIANMVVAIELDSEGDRPDGATPLRPHRQHHLGLGEGAARGPRSVVGRARGADRLPRRRRAHGRRQERHHQQHAAGRLRHRPAALDAVEDRRAEGQERHAGGGRPHQHDPGQALRRSGRVRRGLRVPVLGAGRLHHRAEFADRRRQLHRRVLGRVAELDAQARRGAPDDVAGAAEVIVLDDQLEIFRNAELARHFQAGAGGEQVAHAAIDAAGAVEADRARLERAMTGDLAAFFLHDILRDVSRSQPHRAD